MKDKYGYLTVDITELAEEHKTRLSTEDDAKESLTISELADAVKAFLTKNPSKTVILEGMPPQELLNAPDPLFPEKEPLDADEGVGFEEDPFTDIKLEDTA